MKKFEAGFIGAGNMGGALATAAAKQVTGERVAVPAAAPRTARRRPSGWAAVRPRRRRSSAAANSCFSASSRR